MMASAGGPIAIHGIPIIIAFLVICFLTRSCLSSRQQLQVLSAERQIDLTSPIVRISTTLKVKNIEATTANVVLLAFPLKQAEHIALIKTTSFEGKRKKRVNTELPVFPNESSDAPNGTKLFSVSLLKPLNSGETSTLEVMLILTHVLEPFPSEIGQSESQLVFFHDSAFILSPYHIVEQTTYVKLPSTIETYTRLDPTSTAGKDLKYGRYESRPPLSLAPITVHFENNNPFAVAEDFVREVDVSHWGYLQVTEHYQLFHAGAKHYGVFSRVDYQSRPAITGVSSFRRLLARLPPRVHSVYYRDQIGNISTSHMRSDSQKTDLEIEPRYPMFGGWRATFTIGYGLPLQDFLFESSDGRRFLNFTFGCPLAETTVNRLTVKVVLPEGSKVVSVAVPFSVEQYFERRFSFLDVIGRTVVVMTKANVVPEHNVNFQVYYDFNKFFMLLEPMLLVGAIFVLFVASVAYLWINLTIKR